MASTTGVHKDVLLIISAPGRDEAWEKRIVEKTGGQVEVRWEGLRKPDGSFKKTGELDRAKFEGVTMLYTYEPVPADLVPNLRFVQLSSSGSDLWAAHPKYADPDVVFCTTSGSNAPQIAEWVVGAWLRFQHRFPHYEQLQARATWKAAPAGTVEDSVGLQVGIIGYGGIGRQVARVCHAMGMSVHAYTSSARPTPASRRVDPHALFQLDGLGDPDGTLPASWAHGTTRAELNTFLSGRDLDLLVLCLPLTKASQGLIGREQFAILGGDDADSTTQRRRKPFLVNIARGPIVDHDALVDALATGQIRGAALDVTDPEPLPREHPLWRAENCFITPHVAWQSSHQLGRCFEIMTMNLERLLKGEPLQNELKRLPASLL